MASLSLVIGLLTSALSILGFVQQHPELPQSSRFEAQQTVQKTIAFAIDELQTASESAGKSIDRMPVRLGRCVMTTVKEAQAEQSESTIAYTATTQDGKSGSQVADRYIVGVYNSKHGDSVKICLKSVPTDCAFGDWKGRVYSATNMRTGETWDAPDSRLTCGT